MKVRVVKKFRDKHTSEFHEVGDVLVISKERYKEICEVDKTLVEVEETKKAKKAAE